MKSWNNPYNPQNHRAMDTSTYESHVSHNQAVQLAQLGFNWPCTGKYVDSPNDPVLFSGMECLKWHLETDEVLAPTLAVAQRWLREEHELNVLAYDCAAGYGWQISKAGDETSRGTIVMYFDEEGEDTDSGMWHTYENALSAGISKALDLIS